MLDLAGLALREKVPLAELLVPPKYLKKWLQIM